MYLSQIDEEKYTLRKTYFLIYIRKNFLIALQTCYRRLIIQTASRHFLDTLRILRTIGTLTRFSREADRESPYS